MVAYTRTNRLLTVENLSLAFGPKLILRDINLHVDNLVRPGMNQGQVIALLGPSGIGKTQLFRCIAGLQSPIAGRVLLANGKEPSAGEVGLVFQTYPLLEHRTVWSNLKLAASALNLPEAKILEMLARFGLSDKKDLYPTQLSGGQRQRVAIIQQLLCSSHFILMDEPFSGLDVVMKQKICELIAEVTTAHEENTIILTTHDIETACMIADTIWVLGFEADKPGATCVHQVDLIERGLAWDSNVERHPNFRKTVEELRAVFTCPPCSENCAKNQRCARIVR